MVLSCHEDNPGSVHCGKELPTAMWLVSNILGDLSHSHSPKQLQTPDPQKLEMIIDYFKYGANQLGMIPADARRPFYLPLWCCGSDLGQALYH